LARVLIYHPHPTADDGRALLAEQGHEVVSCEQREALIAAMADRRPDVLVYVLGELPLDLGVLTLLRRLAPSLPLILLGSPAELEARRSVQDLKPVYYGVFPLDPSELADAVRGVLLPRGGQAPSRRTPM
jgi:DNA-binding response OmpR family regulator